MGRFPDPWIELPDCPRFDQILDDSAKVRRFTNAWKVCWLANSWNVFHGFPSGNRNPLGKFQVGVDLIDGGDQDFLLEVESEMPASNQCAGSRTPGLS